MHCYWPVIFFFVCDTFWFGVRVMLTMEDEFGRIPSFAIFKNNLRKIDSNSSLMFGIVYLWRCLMFELFVGILFVTNSLSLLVISLVIFSVSSCFSLKRLYFSDNLLMSSSFSILWWIIVVISHDTLYFNDDSYNFSFFISNFIVLSPLSFFLDSLTKDLTILLIFSKKLLIPSFLHWPLWLLLKTLVSFHWGTVDL